MARIRSLREKPIGNRPRRLVYWLNPTGEKKVHSLVDKVYKMKNLELAWEKVKSNRGAGGIDGQSLEAFEGDLQGNLERLHQELRTRNYQPKPVKRQLIPKSGQPGKFRPLGIPTVYDRVCQQALMNRLEPIFEPVFDEASFGYRRGRSTRDAMRKIWGELEQGNEWIVDADLKDFFGSVDHDKLMELLNQRVSDGRVLCLLESTMKVGYLQDNQIHPSGRGVPQGGVISPLLSNILLTPFDREMRVKGYRLTRYADDWLVTCRTRQEAQAALNFARQVLGKLGVVVNEEKTRIVHISQGFEFLGYKVKRGQKAMRLAAHKIKSKARQGDIYVYPTQKSIDHFKDQIRKRTSRKAPVSTRELIEQLNPVIRGWGNYYRKSHVRKLFNQFDRWIVRRLWSHRHKRWRNCGWKTLPSSKLYSELGLVNMIQLIPSLNRRRGAAL